jgi:transposase
LAEAGWVTETAALDSTYVKAHRSAHGGKGGAGAGHWPVARWPDHEDPRPRRCPRRPAVIDLTPGNVSDVKTAPDVIAAAPGRFKRLIADRGYDANHLRRDLKAARTTSVIPGTRSRKRPIPYDRRRYREPWRIEAAFCRLKDFRRIATRYDKLAVNFASAVALASIIAFWC